MSLTMMLEGSIATYEEFVRDVCSKLSPLQFCILECVFFSFTETLFYYFGYFAEHWTLKVFGGRDPFLGEKLNVMVNNII